MHLGGARIAPYSCNVGPAKLELEAEVEFYDDRGNSGADREEAMYVFERAPSWMWEK